MSLGVETETQSVQHPEPQVASPAVGVGARDATPCHLDPKPAHRLRRPGHRPAGHHLQAGSLVVPTSQQVQTDLGTEPGRADPRPVYPRTEATLPPYARCHEALNRVEVSMAPPQVCVIATPCRSGKVVSMWRYSICSVSGRR